MTLNQLINNAFEKLRINSYLLRKSSSNAGGGEDQFQLPPKLQCYSFDNLVQSFVPDISLIGQKGKLTRIGFSTPDIPCRSYHHDSAASKKSGVENKKLLKPQTILNKNVRSQQEIKYKTPKFLGMKSRQHIYTKTQLYKSSTTEDLINKVQNSLGFQPTYKIKKFEELPQKNTNILKQTNDEKSIDLRLQKKFRETQRNLTADYPKKNIIINRRPIYDSKKILRNISKEISSQSKIGALETVKSNKSLKESSKSTQLNTLLSVSKPNYGDTLEKSDSNRSKKLSKNDNTIELNLPGKLNSLAIFKDKNATATKENESPKSSNLPAAVKIELEVGEKDEQNVDARSMNEKEATLTNSQSVKEDFFSSITTSSNAIKEGRKEQNVSLCINDKGSETLKNTSEDEGKEKQKEMSNKFSAKMNKSILKEFTKENPIRKSLAGRAEILPRTKGNVVTVEPSSKQEDSVKNNIMFNLKIKKAKSAKDLEMSRGNKKIAVPQRTKEKLPLNTLKKENLTVSLKDEIQKWKKTQSVSQELNISKSKILRAISKKSLFQNRSSSNLKVKKKVGINEGKGNVNLPKKSKLYSLPLAVNKDRIPTKPKCSVMTYDKNRKKPELLKKLEGSMAHSHTKIEIEESNNSDSDTAKILESNYRKKLLKLIPPSRVATEKLFKKNTSKLTFHPSKKTDEKLMFAPNTFCALVKQKSELIKTLQNLELKKDDPNLLLQSISREHAEVKDNNEKVSPESLQTFSNLKGPEVLKDKSSDLHNQIENSLNVAYYPSSYRKKPELLMQIVQTKKKLIFPDSSSENEGMSSESNSKQKEGMFSNLNTEKQTQTLESNSTQKDFVPSSYYQMQVEPQAKFESLKPCKDEATCEFGNRQTSEQNSNYSEANNQIETNLGFNNSDIMNQKSKQISDKEVTLIKFEESPKKYFESPLDTEITISLGDKVKTNDPNSFTNEPKNIELINLNETKSSYNYNSFFSDENKKMHEDGEMSPKIQENFALADHKTSKKLEMLKLPFLPETEEKETRTTSLDDPIDSNVSLNPKKQNMFINESHIKPKTEIAKPEMNSDSTINDLTKFNIFKTHSANDGMVDLSLPPEFLSKKNTDISSENNYFLNQKEMKSTEFSEDRLISYNKKNNNKSNISQELDTTELYNYIHKNHDSESWNKFKISEKLNSTELSDSRQNSYDKEYSNSPNAFQELNQIEPPKYRNINPAEVCRDKFHIYQKLNEPELPKSRIFSKNESSETIDIHEDFRPTESNFSLSKNESNHKFKMLKEGLHLFSYPSSENKIEKSVSNFEKLSDILRNSSKNENICTRNSRSYNNFNIFSRAKANCSIFSKGSIFDVFGGQLELKNISGPTTVSQNLYSPCELKSSSSVLHKLFHFCKTFSPFRTMPFQANYGINNEYHSTKQTMYSPFEGVEELKPLREDLRNERALNVIEKLKQYGNFNEDTEQSTSFFNKKMTQKKNTPNKVSMDWLLESVSHNKDKSKDVSNDSVYDWSSIKSHFDKKLKNFTKSTINEDIDQVNNAQEKEIFTKDIRKVKSSDGITKIKSVRLKSNSEVPIRKVLSEVMTPSHLPLKWPNKKTHMLTKKDLAPKKPKFPKKKALNPKSARNKHFEIRSSSPETEPVSVFDKTYFSGVREERTVSIPSYNHESFWQDKRIAIENKSATRNNIFVDYIRRERV